MSDERNTTDTSDVRLIEGQEREKLIAEAVDTVVCAVAELPDRTSPDDWPDAMLVTADELRAIVRAEMLALLQPLPPSQGTTKDETSA